jgi:geranylgeranyl diphosphate synthase type II
MLRRTVEGQELTWIAENNWDISPSSYIEMVSLKTAWYLFVPPPVGGALAAGAPAEICEALKGFGLDLGVAFWIRDDILNLLASESAMGKESRGDLWEEKRTPILSLFLATAYPRACKTQPSTLATRSGSPAKALDRNIRARVRVKGRLYVGDRSAPNLLSRW